MSYDWEHRAHRIQPAGIEDKTGKEARVKMGKREIRKIKEAMEK